MESFNGKFCDELLSCEIFNTLAKAKVLIEQWRVHYNTVRPHFSLGYFGGYIKPANHKENRVDHRLLRNQNGKRKCVVVMREHDGRTLPGAFPTETAAASFIRSHVAQGTEIMANEANSWNALEGCYLAKRINHQLA